MQTTSTQQSQNNRHHMHNHHLIRNFRPGSHLADVGPVLASLWARVFTVLLVIGALWLAVYWALSGNV
jgi:hypothetical protein